MIFNHSHLCRCDDQLRRHFNVQHVPVHCHRYGGLSNGGRVLEHPRRAIALVFILCRTVAKLLAGILDGNVQNGSQLGLFGFSIALLFHLAVLFAALEQFWWQNWGRGWNFQRLATGSFVSTFVRLVLGTVRTSVPLVTVD